MKIKTAICLMLICLITCLSSFAQSKKEISQRLQVLEKINSDFQTQFENLKQSLNDLQIEFNQVKNENELLKLQIADLKKNSSTQSYGIVGNQEQINTNSTPGRCKAITAKGTQCSRNAEPGSDYCWQHKSTYEPNSQPRNLTSTPKSSGSGRVIHTGPRGGKYYINSKGNKTYIKR
jgi:regulator of replication initiation timing